MIVTKDFHSLIEMNKYIEDNNIKSKDICYMDNFLNIQRYCLASQLYPPSKFSLQYENHIKFTTSCVS